MEKERGDESSSPAHMQQQQITYAVPDTTPLSQGTYVEHLGS